MAILKRLGGSGYCFFVFVLMDGGDGVGTVNVIDGMGEEEDW